MTSATPCIAVLVAVAALASCRGKDRGPTLDPAYARDVDRFCNAEEKAGATQIETTAKSMVVADWLGRSLETPKARQFLASLTSVPPAEKARRLRVEARLARLDDCPTASLWEDLASGKSDP